MTLPESPQSPSSDILGSLGKFTPSEPLAFSHLCSQIVPSESDDKGPLSPASSFLSEAFDGDGEPPQKRRRVSYSSLSSDSLSSEEDEKPLAAAASRPEPSEKAPQKSPARNGKGRKGGKTRGKVAARSGGKSMASTKSKAHTAPAQIPPPTDEERAEMERPVANGANGQDAAVKVEDKMDEGQLSRLVTGVTVDTGVGATTATVSTGGHLLFVLATDHDTAGCKTREAFAG